MNISGVPFASGVQLCDDLKLEGTLIKRGDGKTYLPGQPFVSLDEDEVLPYLHSELHTPLLNRMSPWLWLLATPKSTHVTALHASAVRGRTIVITEDPELHLVWMHNRIFIKPMPAYLLSHAFWAQFLISNNNSATGVHAMRTRCLRAALGFTRTYLHLIRHESDLRIAKVEHLVPEHVTFECWAAFISNFKHIEDDQVAGRYHYGDLRLTRLNFWAKPLLRRWRFRKRAWQYNDYLARYITPLLFVFTTWTVVLDSMQVGMNGRPQWDKFASASAWFSVVTLIGVVTIGVFLIFGFCALAGREIVYAFRKQFRKRFRRKPPMQGGASTKQGVP